VLVENGVSLESDIAKIMARLLVTEAFYALFFYQPVASFEGAIKATKLAPQTQITMLAKKLA